MGSRTTLLHSGPTGSMRHVKLKLRPQICYQIGCMQTLHARLRTVAVGLPIRAPPASPGYGLQKNLKQAITKAGALPPGIEHLLEDSALPILKICGMSGVGAYCARQVSNCWTCASYNAAVIHSACMCHRELNIKHLMCVFCRA